MGVDDVEIETFPLYRGIEEAFTIRGNTAFNIWQWHTRLNKQSFIKITLKTAQKLNKVEIKNRDDCCKDRIVGTSFRLEDSNENIIYYSEIKSQQDMYTYDNLDKLTKRDFYQVFHIGGYNWTKAEAEAICKKFKGRLATYAELEEAQRLGADWCSTGWLSDKNDTFYPITTSTQFGCGNGSAGIKQWNPPGGKAGINCFGIKDKSISSEPLVNFNQTSRNSPKIINN